MGSNYLVVSLVGLAVLVSTASAHRPVSYKGYHAFDVSLTTDDHVTVVRQLLRPSRKVMLLHGALLRRSTITLLVSPASVASVFHRLSQAHVEFKIVNSDYQKKLDENAERNRKALEKFRRENNTIDSFDHTAFLSYHEQKDWMVGKLGTPGAGMDLLGHTYEGREIWLFMINNDYPSTKPGILIDANLHARDWLSSANAMYVIDEILSRSSIDADHLFKFYRFYIIVNLNPDGYEFSRTEDRLWRKSRAPVPNTSCFGVDLDRNFNVSFGGADSSGDCQYDDYHGPSPFSEQETHELRQYLIPRINSYNFQMYISLHSYGQQWIVPWAYTSASAPADQQELRRVGEKAAEDATSVHGAPFTSGTSYELRGSDASGTSFDWAKLVAEIPYAYQVFTRPTSEADGGYDPAPETIVPSGHETLKGIATACREMLNDKQRLLSLK